MFKKLLILSVISFGVYAADLKNEEEDTNKVIAQSKQKIIEQFDIDGHSKQTIAQIIDSSFNLRSYKENYFLPVSYRYNSEYVDGGAYAPHEAKDTETEFQVSIRFDFGANTLGLGEIYSFGYTQRSWWQVYVPSAFFRESNYQPEFFVTIPAYSFLGKSAVKGFKLAFIHQSNGRGGEFERSWNRASFSTFFLTGNLITELELWYRFHDKQDYNPDLLDYLGYAQLRFMLPYHKHLFKLSLRSNLSKQKSAVEFMYTYPLPVGNEKNLFVILKTFNGYGESLIDYDHNVNKVSIGLAISR